MFKSSRLIVFLSPFQTMYENHVKEIEQMRIKFLARREAIKKQKEGRNTQPEVKQPGQESKPAPGPSQGPSQPKKTEGTAQPVNKDELSWSGSWKEDEQQPGSGNRKRGASAWDEDFNQSGDNFFQRRQDFGRRWEK